MVWLIELICIHFGGAFPSGGSTLPITMHAFSHTLKDVECLTFDPSTGQLPPCCDVPVAVDCVSPGAIGKFRTVIELLIDGEPAK